MSQLLFRCLHGSHLYGLAGPDSDLDFYEVWSKRPGQNPWVSKRGGRMSEQTIVDGVDTAKKDLGSFLLEANAGVPQALEAMFAPPEAVSVDLIGPLRADFSAYGAWPVLVRYLRTIRTFSDRDSWKHRRHALRLAMNGADIRESGRFNPRLDEESCSALISSTATLRDRDATSTDVEEAALRIFWS